MELEDNDKIGTAPEEELVVEEAAVLVELVAAVVVEDVAVELLAGKS